MITKPSAKWIGKLTRFSLMMLCVGLIVPGPRGVAQVVLNEIMADNATAVENGGSYPDWIELYNRGGAAVDLGGMSLSDDPLNPRRFVFPPGTMLSAGGYLVVWADSDNSAPGIHLGFSLKSSGEIVTLYAPDGFTKLDEVEFGLQLADFSVGRVPDGTGSWTLTEPSPEETNVSVPLGPVTELKLNEWLATSPSEDDWLEVFNPNPQPVDISGLVIADSVVTPVPATFAALPPLSFIAADGFQVFICDGKTSPADHLNFGISTRGETLTIYAPDRVTVIDRVSFGSGILGDDQSMGRLPDGNPGTSYVVFPAGKTTKGNSNFLPITNVVINEVLTHTDPPLEDAIELWNPTSQEVDISYYWLSNDKNNPKKFQIPPGTRIAPNGYIVFYEMVGATGGFNTSGTGEFPDFSLNSAHGDEVYLFSADPAGNLTGFRRGIDFGAAENGVSFGRYVTSTGEPDIVPMSRRTFGRDNPTSVFEFRQGTGLPNAKPKVGPLVITEIMYHPPDIGTNDNTLDEYIELYNISTGSVPLFDTNPYPDAATNTWRLADGIKYKFPSGIVVPPGGFLLLVNFDPQTNTTQLAAFRAKYGIPDSFTQFYGPYKGKLKNSKATIELRKTDRRQLPPHSDAGFVPEILVERIKYTDSEPWPTEPDGSGMALQRLVPEDYGNDPINWTAAAPTPGRQYLRIESIERAGNGIKLRFQGWAGSSYTVQYRESLSSGSWKKLQDVPAQETSGVREVTDSNFAVSATRFYRIVSPAQR